MVMDMEEELIENVKEYEHLFNPQNEFDRDYTQFIQNIFSIHFQLLKHRIVGQERKMNTLLIKSNLSDVTRNRLIYTSSCSMMQSVAV